MVKKELGPDALILSTRTIKNSKFGLLRKPILEITAAIEPAMPHTPPSSTRNLSSGFNHVVDDSLDHLVHQGTLESGAGPAVISCSTPDYSREKPDYGIHNEVNELKNLIKGLAGEVSQLHKKERNQFKTNSRPHRSNGAYIHENHIMSMLVTRGLNSDAARTIIDLLPENILEQTLEDPELLLSVTTETIENLLEVAPPVFSSAENQQRIALVGPTGVGKTTTLAKIAASYLTNYSNSIALITIDTYRIAAVEQLKVYGEIMHLPVDVVITPDQLKIAIEHHRDKDLILIDTAGRSPKDDFCIEELSTFLVPDLNIDKHLVLSATTRENELFNIIQRFNALAITNTIFTKIDECTNLGVLLNIQFQDNTPLSYVTNGQRVPEDIIEASQKTVAELVMSQHEGLLYD